jgi:hypothetical protein
MKSKKQRRFERRLAERRLRQQGDVVKATGKREKEPAADRPNGVRGECSRNPSCRTPGFQKPGIPEKRKEEI